VPICFRKHSIFLAHLLQPEQPQCYIKWNHNFKICNINSKRFLLQSLYITASVVGNWKISYWQRQQRLGKSSKPTCRLRGVSLCAMANASCSVGGKWSKRKLRVVMETPSFSFRLSNSSTNEDTTILP